MVLWGCPPPRGYLSVSSVPPEEHGIKGLVPQPPGSPLVGPAQPPVHLPNPVPVPGPGPLCPSRWLPPLPLCLRRRCRAPPPPPPRPSALALWVQRIGELGLGSSGDCQEVTQSGGSRVVAAIARGGGAGLFSRLVLFMEVRAEVGDVSAITPDTPPHLLLRVLVAQGLELRFTLAMMVRILTEMHVPGGSVPPGPRVAVLPVPL